MDASGAGERSDGAAGGGGQPGGPGIPDGGVGLEWSVSPGELIFSGVQNTRSPTRSVSLQNPTASPIQIASVALDVTSPGSAAFELVNPPQAGAQVPAGGSASVGVVFHPTSVATFAGRLLIRTVAPATLTTVSLYGLGARGLEGANEPFLKAVLDTLGFAVNVGGNALLSTTTPLLGEEVQAFRFKAAGAGPIKLVPVARYSPDGPIPFGTYTAAGEVQVGVISTGDFQALNPATDPGAMSSFVAPAGEFGVFTVSGTHKTYTEDPKNAANAVVHAIRTYPLKDRQGVPVANSYLLCVEEAANGDYQDYVLTLSNVIRVAR